MSKKSRALGLRVGARVHIIRPPHNSRRMCDDENTYDKTGIVTREGNSANGGWFEIRLDPPEGATGKEYKSKMVYYRRGSLQLVDENNPNPPTVSSSPTSKRSRDQYDYDLRVNVREARKRRRIEAHKHDTIGHFQRLYSSDRQEEREYNSDDEDADDDSDSQPNYDDDYSDSTPRNNHHESHRSLYRSARRSIPADESDDILSESDDDDSDSSSAVLSPPSAPRTPIHHGIAFSPLASASSSPVYPSYPSSVSSANYSPNVAITPYNAPAEFSPVLSASASATSSESSSAKNSPSLLACARDHPQCISPRSQQSTNSQSSKYSSKSLAPLSLAGVEKRYRRKAHTPCRAISTADDDCLDPCALELRTVAYPSSTHQPSRVWYSPLKSPQAGGTIPLLQHYTDIDPSHLICASCRVSTSTEWHHPNANPLNILLCGQCYSTYQKYRQYCHHCSYIFKKHELNQVKCTHCRALQLHYDPATINVAHSLTQKSIKIS